MNALILLAATKATQIPKVFGDVNMFVTAAVCAVGFLLLAILISSLIKYEPGSNPKDPRKRRLWFWILGVLAVILVFVLLFFVIPVPVDAIDWTNFTPGEKKNYENAMAHYTMMAGIATGTCFVAYVVLGLILSKVFKNKKIGDWF